MDKVNSSHLTTIKNALAREGTKIKEIYDKTLEVIFTEDSGYTWSLCKAVLGLIIIDLEKYEDSKNQAILNIANNSETQEKLINAANSLLCNIQINLTDVNKENFAKNFSTFRQILSTIN